MVSKKTETILIFNNFNNKHTHAHKNTHTTRQTTTSLPLYPRADTIRAGLEARASWQKNASRFAHLRDITSSSYHISRDTTCVASWLKKTAPQAHSALRLRVIPFTLSSPLLSYSSPLDPRFFSPAPATLHAENTVISHAHTKKQMLLSDTLLGLHAHARTHTHLLSHRHIGPKKCCEARLLAICV